MSFARLSLKGRALKLLARREHSRLELERKLAAHAQEGDDLNAILDELEQRGFISAQRVVESVMHRKASRFGAARVLHELRAKGLDEDTLRAAAGQLRATEPQRAHALWLQRFGAPPATPQERLRQARFLAARGFAADVIGRVVRGGGAEE
jgi:regulatory protein